MIDGWSESGWMGILQMFFWMRVFVYTSVFMSRWLER